MTVKRARVPGSQRSEGPSISIKVDRLTGQTIQFLSILKQEPIYVRLRKQARDSLIEAALEALDRKPGPTMKSFRRYLDSIGSPNERISDSQLLPVLRDWLTEKFETMTPDDCRAVLAMLKGETRG